MIERSYLTSLDGFIFNSATTKGVIEELVGSEHSSVIAYPGGDRLGVTLNTEQIRARAYEPGPLRIFFLGNIIPRKGLHTLLDALAQLPTESWMLTAAGSLDADRDYTASIQSQIERLHIADQVSLPGPLSGETLIEQLKRHHVLAMPSSYEGFGIVYVEGMALGLPPIGTTQGAARELISHGENGFLIEPGDSDHLAEYLEILVVNRERLAAMSLAARQRFDQCPTWDQSAAAAREFLRSIVDQTKASQHARTDS
jgi:glycosyltransferase involved in cell wall biosynthesis